MQIITMAPFFAKCTMREAPSIMELLCNEILELMNKSRIQESEMRPEGLIMSDQQAIEMAINDSERHARKM